MALNAEEKKALKLFKSRLEETLGNRLVELKLFGSKARGDDRPDSDVDVLVIVSDEGWRIRDMVYDIVTDILLEKDVCISPKVIGKTRFEQLCKEGTSFIHNISKDAIVV